MIKKLAVVSLFLVLYNALIAQEADSLFMLQAKNRVKYKVAGIRVEGASATDQNVIILFSGLIKGEEITIPGDRTSDAIKKLWKQGLFEDVQLYGENAGNGQISLVIRVVERPRLTSFKFKGGVKRGEAEDLRPKLHLMKERVVTDYMIGTIRNTVKDYYLDKGYYYNEVKIQQIRDTAQKNPHTIVTIEVVKNRKVRIQEVNFIGNTVVPAWKLRRSLEDSKRFRWYNPFNSAKYLEENLKKDLPAIAGKYSTKGYRDARVAKDTVYFISDNRVAIDITIDEGHKYYFGKFNWFGNTKYRGGQLDTVLNIKAGDVYDQSKLEQKLYMNPSGYDVSSLYLDDGYLFFRSMNKRVTSTMTLLILTFSCMRVNRRSLTRLPSRAMIRPMTM